jgi:biotin transport system substrate-specific component
MTSIGKNSATSRPWISTREMAFCSLFAILVGVGANVKIPLPYVPITLQTVMVFLAGLLLGSKRGALALFMYMLLGLVGLPMFSSGGGFQNIVSPSFGFVVGFIPAAWIAGRIRELAAPRVKTAAGAAASRFIACLAAELIFDFIGVVWLYLNLNYIAGKGVTIYQALQAGLFPFLIPDALKLAVAVVIASIVASRVPRFDGPTSG